MYLNPTYSKYAIGDYSYGFPKIITYIEDDRATVKIGRFCSIANEVTIILGGEHYTNWVSTFPFSVYLEGAAQCALQHYSRGDITIGNDVWIGHDAVILSGVTIGNGAVVGARSVVTRDIPPYAIAVGQPAKIVRYRFGEQTIEALQQIAWWDWDISEIRKAAPILSSGEIDSFIQQYGNCVP
jgi:virginiamycin A acetyltransferase